MSETIEVPVIVITSKDELVATVNAMLRETGYATHCERIHQPHELTERLDSGDVEAILLAADEPSLGIDAAMDAAARLTPQPPIIVIRETVTEETIAEAMDAGARDVVSLGLPNRVQQVFTRELKAFRLEKALQSVHSSASQYQQELQTLVDGAVEAIATVQEGIVVGANPAWTELFRYESEDDLIGVPLMDLCAAADQQVLKGALRACMKGKWTEDSLTVSARRQDDSEVSLDLELEDSIFDEEPAIRLKVSTEAMNNTPEELVEQAVRRDPVTGFFRRGYFLQRLEETLETEPKAGIRAIAYVRPDQFAKVHSDIGLLGTELVLTQLADLIRDYMQPTDLYGRFGGTMFMAVVERGTMNDVEAWAEQITRAVSERVFDVDDRSTTLTCTIGLCEIDGPSDGLSEILEEAEGACRTGRDGGGNRVQLGERSGASKLVRQEDEAWIPRLRSALMENRFRLVHQAIAGLTEEVDGMFDTMVRLVDEQNDTILPAEFMPAAERCGLVKMIDRWVIGASVSFCAQKEPNLLFVRLGLESVLDDELLTWLDKCVADAGIQTDRLAFEVSEEIAASHLKHVRELADALRSRGFKFAVDHFGTGRDSQQILTHIEMDYVKIDGSLMQGLHRDNALQTKVRKLARDASERGITSIAERVQDANTMAVLWQLGISLIQGNYTQMNDVVLEDTTQQVPQLSETQINEAM